MIKRNIPLISTYIYNIKECLFMIKKFKNGNIVLDIRDDIRSGYYEKNIESI